MSVVFLVMKYSSCTEYDSSLGVSHGGDKGENKLSGKDSFGRWLLHEDSSHVQKMTQSTTISLERCLSFF